MSKAQASFLWHDYETSGTDPARDRPLQFAAIRTDAALNVVDEPLMFYCKPARDVLPQPEACLVTGISPQHAELNGFTESQCIAEIHSQMMQPGTCVAGYNNIRFDDEFTRFTLYRNFYDAYEREWKNGNSRWDLIDVLRLCAAVRPEGIVWPCDDEGLPGFRLEMLTAANNIEQAGAHDALVDVRATIDMARLVRDKQPKLYDYTLSMRNKKQVAGIVQLGSSKPLLHVSGMFGSRNHCASVVLPLCMHPVNKNAVIALDLRESPDDFLGLSVDEIRQRVFSSHQELGDTPRIALKNIHLNKCPMLAPVSMVTEEVAQRLKLDMQQLRRHYDALVASPSEWGKAADVFAERDLPQALSKDVDLRLYTGGFFSDADKSLMSKIRHSKPQQLASQVFAFEDERLPEMLFRYRARNFPDSLSESEQQRWQQYCFTKLTDPAAGATITMEAYQEQLEKLFMLYQDDEQKMQLLGQLMDWADSLL